MAIDLGKIEVSKNIQSEQSLRRRQVQDRIVEAGAMGIKPYKLVTDPTAPEKAKANFLSTLGLGLSTGAMAFAEGMGAGKPYSNFVAQQQAMADRDIASAKAQQDLAKWKYEQANKEWKPTTQEEALDFEKAKVGMKAKKEGELPASIMRQKNLDTSNILKSASQYALTNERIKQSLANLDKLPTGAKGALEIKTMSLLGSKDPILSEWQNLKSLLSQIQLGQLQFTKGAISDNEMKFFARAVANDDIQSYPKIKSVLTRALEDNNAQLESAKAAYEKNYGENPDELLGKVGGNQVIDAQTQKALDAGYTMAEIEAFKNKSKR